MKVSQAKNIFMVGIMGSGMRSLAYLLSQTGHVVTGSDQSVKEKKVLADGYTVMPEEEGVAEAAGCDLIIYSDAVVAEHPVRLMATEKGIVCIPYHEALGQFAADYTTIAITGTHGKSSTTAFLAHILTAAGLDPTVLIGAAVPAWGGKGARLGQSQYFVVEADEYREHFLQLAPMYIVITSVDFDHPDYFKSLEEVKISYQKFLQRLKPEGKMVALESLIATEEMLQGTSVVSVPDQLIGTRPLALPGKHMRRNAALAVAVAAELGVPQDEAIEHLATFTGLSRRFELVGEMNQVPVYSDYGHHPAEIATTLTGLRETYPGKKIAVLVEPHMIERVEKFFDGFVQALSGADEAVICPVFFPKGREGTVTDAPERLLTAVQAKGGAAQLLPGWGTLPAIIKDISARNDMIVAFTAGALDAKLRELLNV